MTGSGGPRELQVVPLCALFFFKWKVPRAARACALPFVPNLATKWKAPNTATKTWLHLARNRIDRAYYYTCGSCGTSLQYRKEDAAIALGYHLGEYCANPDPSASAPVPLKEETLPKSRTATMWKNEQDCIRSTLLAIVNVLTQATGPERAASLAPAGHNPRRSVPRQLHRSAPLRDTPWAPYPERKRTWTPTKILIASTSRSDLRDAPAKPEHSTHRISSPSTTRTAISWTPRA